MSVANTSDMGPLGMRVASGATLLIGASVLNRFISILNVAVLARLLTPADYGIVALAMVALGMAQQFSEMQIGNALIRLPKIEETHYTTAFTLGLMRGLLMAAVLFGLSDIIAAGMDTPALGPVLRWIALVPLIDALASPRFIGFAHQLDFRREVLISLTGRVVSLVTAIAVAMVSADYWALIVGMIAAAAVGIGLTHWVAPWRPRLGLQGWRDFLGFGLWLTVSGVVSFATYKSDTVMVGASLGTATLGQFNMGEQMATMATHQIATPITRAIFTGLARVGDDPDRLRRAYLKAQSSVLAIVLPIGVGSGLVGPELVRVVAGSQWEAAVPILQVVAPTIAVSMVVSGAHSLMMVRDDTRSIFMRNLATFCVRLPLIVAGLWLFGVPGVLAAKVLGSAFLIWMTLRLVVRNIGGRLLDPYFAAWRSFAACAAMTGTVMAYGAWLPEPGSAFWHNAAALGAKVAIGGATYCLSHLGLWLLAGRPDGFERIALDTAARLVGQIRRRLA